MAAAQAARPASLAPCAEFEERFELGQLLGKGGFGSVYSCRDRRTGSIAACKVLNKDHVKRTLGVDASREARTMQELVDHKGIIQLVEAYEDQSHHYVVMEHCAGSTLLHLLKAKGAMPEQGARAVLGQVAAALAFCHSKRVLHLDIKPDNIFFLDDATDVLHEASSVLDSKPGWLVRAKLADFGMATVLKAGKKVRGDVGSPHFKAPEIVGGKKFGFEVDVWSLGVVLCVMLTGTVPFLGSSNHDTEGLNAAILRGYINFDHLRWWHVSAEAKDLVSKMLQVDPAKRITAAEILDHPWLNSGAQEPQYEAEVLPSFAPAQAATAPPRQLSRASASLASPRPPCASKALKPATMKALKPLPRTVQLRVARHSNGISTSAMFPSLARHFAMV